MHHDARANPETGFANTPTGRIRHSISEQLTRHCHREPFAALVLGGGYLESGDAGRFEARAGDVLLHGPYESHSDDVGPAGADVLVLPWKHCGSGEAFGRVADPDAIVRAGEQGPAHAVRALAEQFTPVIRENLDWPDRLARDLRSDPTLSITIWCEQTDLRPETVSRGFRKAFGVSPKAYRARLRLLRSLTLISDGGRLADVAAQCGFADQSHLGREILSLTGRTPAEWRKGGR